jgi:hypothetical protein
MRTEEDSVNRKTFASTAGKILGVEIVLSAACITGAHAQSMPPAAPIPSSSAASVTGGAVSPMT